MPCYAGYDDEAVRISCVGTGGIDGEGGTGKKRPGLHHAVGSEDEKEDPYRCFWYHGLLKDFFFRSGSGSRLREHVARARTVGRTDDPLLFEKVHEACGT